MQAHLRELIADLKAAVAIGHPESLAVVLEVIRELPDEALPPSALLPLGCACSRLPVPDLHPLLDDPDPAIRGMAAVALAEHFQRGDTVPLELMALPAGDPNPEVRSVFVKALITGRSRDQHLETMLSLAENWLTSDAPETLACGLGLLPALIRLRTHQPDFDRRLWGWLQPLHTAEDHDLRAVLVESLDVLAEKGASQLVLKLIDDWVRQPDPNIWVITRVLSASWTTGHLTEAISLLDQLGHRVGKIRSILRALNRLQRKDEKV